MIGGLSIDEPAHAEDEQIHRIRQQRETHDHLERARPQQQPHAGARQHADREREDDLHQTSAIERGLHRQSPCLDGRVLRGRRSDWCASAMSISTVRADDHHVDAEIEQQHGRQVQLAEQRQVRMPFEAREERCARKPRDDAGDAGAQQAERDPVLRMDAQARFDPQRRRSSCTAR